MNKYVLNSEFYIVFNNGDCQESHLPDRVCYQEGVLSFDNIQPVEVQVIYLLDKSQSMDLCIKVASRSEVSLIESKILDSQASLHKTMMIANDAIMHVFSENTSQDAKSE